LRRTKKLNRGGQANRFRPKITINRGLNRDGWPTASVNRLTEAGKLRQPSRLILINRGGFLVQLKDLIEESNKLLQGWTYLIVQDNVSSISEWNFLMRHIIEEENTSRIIVTTREKSVAEYCSIDNIYKLEALEDIAALELFKKKVTFFYY
jgi:hypothetical protein